jgi:hypothetical protein
MVSPRIDGPRQGTWRPALSGILCITAGLFDLLLAGGLVIAVLGTGTSNLLTEADIYPLTMEAAGAIVKGMAVYLAVAGMLALVGGLFAAQRKNWGFALAGSIAAAMSFWTVVLGVPAIVFTAISKQEFS